MIPTEEKRIRCCFEGDYLAPNGFGRIMRELLPAARSMEIPLALKLVRSPQHQPDFQVHPFLEKVARRPPSGRVRLVFQPAHALPQPIGSGVYWALSGFHHPELSATEARLLNAYARILIPSAVHADALVAAGIPRERLTVFTPGVDSRRFHPRVLPGAIVTPSRKFTFLFVGSPTWRQGLDLLLRAYLEEFRAAEPVRLVIKLTHMPKLKKQFSWEITDLAKRLGGLNRMFPEVQVIAETIPDEEMPALYKSAHVLVSANRGYQHALAIREAMSAGIPVIGPKTPGDFTGLTDKNGFPVATLEGRSRPGELFADSPVLRTAEPDPAELKAAMRRAFAGPDLVKERGRIARKAFDRVEPWQMVAEHLYALVRREADARKESSGADSPASVSSSSTTATGSGTHGFSSPKRRPDGPPRRSASSADGPSRFSRDYKRKPASPDAEDHDFSRRPPRSGDATGPTRPAKPGKPGKSGTPVETGKPGKPGKPFHSGSRGNPGTPTNAANAANASKPATPVQTGKTTDRPMRSAPEQTRPAPPREKKPGREAPGKRRADHGYKPKSREDPDHRFDRNGERKPGGSPDRRPWAKGDQKRKRGVDSSPRPAHRSPGPDRPHKSDKSDKSDKSHKSEK
jgi:glycosyltransferase involved in cell wall biosynthesis